MEKENDLLTVLTMLIFGIGMMTGFICGIAYFLN